MFFRLKIVRVDPNAYALPHACPACGGEIERFYIHQPNCRKPLRDPQLSGLSLLRVRCPICRHSFRVYPNGVDRGQQSVAMKQVSVLLYLLGMSYAQVEHALEGIGWYLGRSTVCRNVHETGEWTQALRRSPVGHTINEERFFDSGAFIGRYAWHDISTAIRVLRAKDGSEVLVEASPLSQREEIVAWLGQVASALGADLSIPQATSAQINDRSYVV